MITDVEYREYEEDMGTDVVINPEPRTRFHTTNGYPQYNDREDQLMELSWKLQHYCHKHWIPIFNHPHTTSILMDLL